MQHRVLGSTGLVVSRLSLGAMTFGEGPLVGQLVNSINQKAADAMVNTALDAGVNLFDTADMYTGGQSETILGRSLKDKRRDVVIATKLGFRSGEAVISCGLSRRYIFQALEASLKRLGTNYIDLLDNPKYFDELYMKWHKERMEAQTRDTRWLWPRGLSCMSRKRTNCCVR